MQFHVEFQNREQRELHELALARAARFSIAEAELLEVIMRVDQERLYNCFKLSSTFSYCTEILRLSRDVALNFIRVARAALEVPKLLEVIEQGNLSVSKARKITSVLTAENQDIWIDNAIKLPQAKLEREVANLAPEEIFYEQAKPVSGNLVCLRLYVTQEEADEIARARKVIARKRKSAVKLSETVVHMTDYFLKYEDPVKKAERLAKKKQEPEMPRSSDPESTQKVSPSRDHTCLTKPSRDKPSATKLSSDYTPATKTSRRRVTIPAHNLHAVNHRDQGCCRARKPNGEICLSQEWVEIHHIVARAKGGTHEPENLITLCAAHHRQWHTQFL